MIYDKENGECNSVLAEKKYLETISELEKAKISSEPFFFISSSRVFNRKIDRKYHEGSVPNGTDPSSLFLIQTEKKILEYENGYVFRKQDVFSEIKPFICKIIAFESQPIFCNESLRLLSDSLYKDLLKYAIQNTFGNHKIFHIAMPTEYELHEVWFRITEKPFTIDNKKANFCFEKNVGFIYSEILSKLNFYHKIISRNKEDIIKALANISQERIDAK